MSNNILKLCVCVVFDRIACVYSAPMSFQNEACAERYMNDTFFSKPSASDYELYKVAEFDIEKGCFEPLEEKTFICRGVYNEKEE